MGERRRIERTMSGKSFFLEDASRGSAIGNSCIIIKLWRQRMNDDSKESDKIFRL